MHKYVPRIHVIAASDYASLHWGMPTTINTAAFNVCSFIAVTAYAVSSHSNSSVITDDSLATEFHLTFLFNCFLRAE